jgi:hypothetical protein
MSGESGVTVPSLSKKYASFGIGSAARGRSGAIPSAHRLRQSFCTSSSPIVPGHLMAHRGRAQVG